ncbi:hypothetical protein CRE_07076 [Caenorhabditis remanei]|uniref:Reverse transcriptase domain-containing protein n=1 Tax=Caenorhabditis remanei TaxID=31234 RepID=E3NJH0_CAERE|nr:hypothetical protein CRE_07076 [Caenorhabditis remanei]
MRKFQTRIKKIQHDIKKQLFRREKHILSTVHSRSALALINKRLKCRSTIPHLSIGSDLITSDSSKASIFAAEFLSNYNTSTHSPPTLVPNNPSSPAHPQSSRDTFSPWVIEQVISKIPPKCGFSLHLANYFIIKNCATSLALPLSIIYSESLESSVVPSAWKHGTIIPVFKKGNPSSPQNYRPITLTDPFARIFERILCRQIRTDLGHRFSIHQHGFLARRSCPSSLVYSTANYRRILKTHHSLDVVFFDFKKAFDKVDHIILLKKLANFGLSNPHISWFEAFLKERTFSVMVNGSLDNKISPIPSGVPQGTVSGPLLFLIYINDLLLKLPPNIPVQEAKYAYMFRSIRKCLSDIF